MLNITGGGESRFKKDKQLTFMKPTLRVEPGYTGESIVKLVDQLFGF
jgi:hypothetical protein